MAHLFQGFCGKFDSEGLLDVLHSCVNLFINGNLFDIRENLLKLLQCRGIFQNDDIAAGSRSVSGGPKYTSGLTNARGPRCGPNEERDIDSKPQRSCLAIH